MEAMNLSDTWNLHQTHELMQLVLFAPAIEKQATNIQLCYNM